MSVRRHVLPTLAVLAVSVAVAACSSGGGSGEGTSGPASTATVTTVTSTAPGSSPGTPSATTPDSAPVQTSRPLASGSPQSPGEPGTAVCLTSQLSLSPAGSNGAAGTIYQTWDLTNTGTTACSMTGYPGFAAAVGDKAATIVGRPADRDPDLVFDGTTKGGPVTVVLQPRQRARFVSATPSTVPAGCAYSGYGTYARVIPPNQTQPLRYRARIVACNLRVGPLRPVS